MGMSIERSQFMSLSPAPNVSPTGWQLPSVDGQALRAHCVRTCDQRCSQVSHRCVWGGWRSDWNMWYDVTTATRIADESDINLSVPGGRSRCPETRQSS